MRNRVSRAFTLVEILIVVVILGILAAIVVPQFTNASQDAQVGNIETQLQTIRSQLELYRVKNNGQYPPMANWTALIGPNYMRAAPVNPRNGGTGIAAGIAPDEAAPPSAGGTDPSATIGWYFDGDEESETYGTLTAAGFNEDFRSDGTNEAWHK